MIRTAHTKSPRLVSAVLALLLLLLSLFPVLTQTVYAAETNGELKAGWAEYVELKGEFNETFTLTSTPVKVFYDNNAAPGDVWAGELTVKNSCNGPMQVSILSILSDIQDKMLFQVLDLEISVDGEIYYNGGYGDENHPVTPYFVVPAGDTMVFDCSISFPAEAGNEYMGKEMDSTWTIEAVYLGDGPGPAMYPYTVKYIDKDTGLALLEDKYAYGAYGTTVTEKAADIDGYTVDAKTKSIEIDVENNVIIFYYTNNDPDPVQKPEGDTPAGPGQDTQKPSGGSVQTGHELSQSNTMMVVYLILIGFCAVAIIITAFRIKAAIRNTRNDK